MRQKLHTYTSHNGDDYDLQRLPEALQQMVRAAKTGTTRPWQELTDEQQGNEGIGFSSTASTKMFQTRIYDFFRRIRQLAQVPESWRRCMTVSVGKKGANKEGP